MNLESILNTVRERLSDSRGLDNKRLWPTSYLCSAATDAEAEIARELQLLKSTDVIGYIDLTDGTSGSISVSVSGVMVTSGPVSFATNRSTTATNLAANITATVSSPNYRALSRGPFVVLRAIPQSGVFPASGYQISVTCTGTLTATVTDLVGLCRHVPLVGQRYLPMHDKLLNIRRVKLGKSAKPVDRWTKDDLDVSYPGWETMLPATPWAYAPDYESREIILIPPPAEQDVVEIDCERLPFADLTSMNLAATPEISAEHHLTMVEWILKTAYLKRDLEETYDPVKAGLHEKEFRRRIDIWEWEQLRRTNTNPTSSIPRGLL